MEFKNIFSFDIKWNFKTISAFLFLLILPNLLGVVNFSTPFGFQIHSFQVAVFLAALIYGPSGGFLSGFVGSFYSALLTGNPYIIVGNAILGFFVGLFARYGFNVALSVLLAYMIQLPWLLITDFYLVHLPVPFLQGLIIALLVSNMVWAIVASVAIKPVKKLLE
ncbi:MAG: hypothetical protein QF824_02235 [Candidatus Woesearchaeota archaeon]|jgi:uncharacterized membrane protein|nr:hypothetical protein [Candidatus Woesearchaeota archaeon]